MALPSSKYSKPKHTPGGEFTLDEKEYTGWYVVTYQNKYFTGKFIDDLSREIFPIVKNSTKPKILTSETITPSIQDRNQGKMTRYFLQNKNNLSIIEVTKNTFVSIRDASKFRKIQLDWKIRGPLENVNKGPYIYYGALHQNRETVLKAELNAPGISTFIKDYSEFVE